MKFKTFLLCFIVIFFINSFMFSENIYFFSKNTFGIAQFWQGYTSGTVFRDSYGNVTSGDSVDRKFFSNFLLGSIGMGMEMVIWDNGITKGSRIFFKTSLNLNFSGPTYIGYYNYDVNKNINDDPMKEVNISGSALFTGTDFDLMIGGTFPKTNLFWGVGSSFYFVFPTSYKNQATTNFGRPFYFYAAPAIALGYDIFIPKTNFKITPQIRTGITCNPLIPSDIMDNSVINGYDSRDDYSGLYIDISVAFSFYTIKWKN